MRLALLLSIAFAAAPALAEPQIRENTCALHDDVVRALSVRFGELRREGRMNGTDYDLELWSSIFGGWTTLMILPDGLTCVTTDGDLWPEAPPEMRPGPGGRASATPGAAPAPA